MAKRGMGGLFQISNFISLKLERGENFRAFSFDPSNGRGARWLCRGDFGFLVIEVGVGLSQWFFNRERWSTETPMESEMARKRRGRERARVMRESIIRKDHHGEDEVEDGREGEEGAGRTAVI